MRQLLEKLSITKGNNHEFCLHKICIDLIFTRLKHMTYLRILVLDTKLGFIGHTYYLCCVVKLI